MGLTLSNLYNYLFPYEVKIALFGPDYAGLSIFMQWLRTSELVNGSAADGKLSSMYWNRSKFYMNFQHMIV